MKHQRIVISAVLTVLALAGLAASSRSTAPPTLSAKAAPASPSADNPNPPASPVKLIFIHHSTGGNWLADQNEEQPWGGLGIALRDNNYFVSATNYGWGPRSEPSDPYTAIGSRTDIVNWPEWFTGPNSSTILNTLYSESGQNVCNPSSPSDECFGTWSRLPVTPTGENEIVLFKSCFPNSNLDGNPDDPPASTPNDYDYSVSNAKAVYNNLLTYFATRQDKLFVVITAPPRITETTTSMAANARAFNTWLVKDWLASNSYTYTNVAVFDYYNVLSSNGSDGRVDDPSTNEEPNDWATRPDGNHHYWNGSAVVYTKTVDNNLSAYPTDSIWDDHPTTAGHQKATAEFVELLNVFYNRWKGSAPTPTPTLHLTVPNGGENWQVGSPQQIRWTSTGTIANVSLAYSTDSFGTSHVIQSSTANTGLYTWTTPVTPSTSMRVRVASTVSPTIYDDSNATFTLYQTGTQDHFTYLPVILKSPTQAPPGTLVQPAGFTYLGAFRLPDDADRPRTFEYGGNAMTFNPSGDPSSSDGFPGSLFIMGHDRLAWGELPNGNQVAEISIPVPVASSTPGDLNTAAFLQGFANVLGGHFTQLVEDIPRAGMAYLNTSATGPKLHVGLGQHLPPDQPVPTHAWFDINLSNSNFQGEWYIGNQSFDSINGYMFEIPAAWADTNASGRYLGTGRYRDGGWSGMGPALFAYKPWLPDGSAPVSGTHLAETPLLLYASSRDTENIEHALKDYQHPDEWEGGAWLTTSSGKTAVFFAGTKSTGAKYWYGWVHPDGADLPCIEVEFVNDFTTCRLANGTPCPAGDLTGCTGHNDYRGWWSTRFDAQFILYNPADLAKVAAGSMQSWEPQPYATLDVDDHLYFNPPTDDLANLGTGDQRRMRIGDVAYDRAHDLLYVLEQFGDEAKPMVHVWRVR
ncbi:MAG: hypothetical protein JW850_11605 [Thermoflexales bacterium]|nr:hypothetical protein [Thermoflexales bacterium]